MYAIGMLLLFITFPILISLLLLWFAHKSAQNKRLPPSPPKLPILGNLHQLGSLPHQDLHAMARKHGPLMLLHFGSVPVLVVSSAEAAAEIMKTHDLTFASRPDYKAFKKLFYGRKGVAFTPYGEHWRQMRSVIVLQLLSGKRVESFRTIREEETTLFVRKIEELEGRPVEMCKMFSEFSNDLICRSAFGTKLRSESRKGKELLRMLHELLTILGAICIGDFIPWLSWIDRVTGFDKRMDRAGKAMDDFLEDLIQERIEASKGVNLDTNEQNFVDIMLQLKNEDKDGSLITKEAIKAVLIDIITGGTDTISTTLGWAMTELLRHAPVLEKLQNEVRAIGEDKWSRRDDHDITELPYLKAVIKETLRLHPPLPLVAPRLARKDATIKGFEISAGTVTIVNAWSIGREAASWDDAEEFRPERFLESSIGFKGVDFEFIPFGAGRRGCPGTAYAVAEMEFFLATIMQKFDWKLGNGAQGKDLDIMEAPGFAARRANPLFVVATKSA